MTTISDERLAEIRQKVREEIMSSAAILRPEELTLTVDDVLERAIRAQGGVASHEASPAPVSEELVERIENAKQAMSETHSSWESRCHAIMAALGIDYGRLADFLPDDDRGMAKEPAT